MSNVSDNWCAFRSMATVMCDNTVSEAMGNLATKLDRYMLFTNLIIEYEINIKLFANAFLDGTVGYDGYKLCYDYFGAKKLTSCAFDYVKEMLIECRNQS